MTAYFVKTVCQLRRFDDYETRRCIQEPDQYLNKMMQKVWEHFTPLFINCTQNALLRITPPNGDGNTDSVVSKACYQVIYYMVIKTNDSLSIIE